MANKSAEVIKNLGRFVKPGLFDSGLGAGLPDAYRKFYKEWKETEPTAVHYIPEEGRWKRDEVTGQVHPIQNIPIPVKYPKEQQYQIWGGVGIIQGFKKKELQRRVPAFWIPTLKRSVVYSEVLDKYFSVIVTDRTISLIHANYGFDHYLLKTPACDLKALLPLGLKRKILQELQNGCPTYANRPEKQNEILKQYERYLASYTPEEIEWYGYSFTEACRKLEDSIKAQQKTIPLKQIYRVQLIETLKAAGIKEAEENKISEPSWIEKINPFSKKRETEK